MGLLSWLRAGTLGVRFDLPASFLVQRDDDLAAKALDRAKRTEWHFFFFPKMHLDLSAETEPSLQRDVECHARYLLASMRRGAAAPGTAPFSAPNQRSPLISCERVVVDGKPALSVLHRMAMEPGREIVMGHLLIPVAKGLFEARWLTLSTSTGLRESVLLARALSGQLDDPNPTPPVMRHVADLPTGVGLGLIQSSSPDANAQDAETLMKTLDYDHPKYDEQFPDHVLTVARRAGVWLRDDAGVAVTMPAVPSEARAVELLSMACSIVPPPRCALDESSRSAARFHRVSLAGNDGVQQFVLQRTDRALQDAAAAELAKSGITKATAESIDAMAPLSAALVLEGESENEEARVVAASFALLEHEHVLLLRCTPSDPTDALLDELAAAARSLRPVARPWWRFW